ncbi:unnamed protein product, partial [Polarella glacialis]
MSSPVEPPPEVLSKFEGHGASGSVLLNRPSKLNALNLNMIRLLHDVMEEVDYRKGRLGCLIMEGAGGKAFCAGGDVVKVREESMNGGTLPQDFFYEEYAVVFRLATLYERTGCCQVSLWDGVTMGGGVGLSAHGPFRVVTEKTVFAKPEMAIGLFPDVGSTHKLSLALSPAGDGDGLPRVPVQRAQGWCQRRSLHRHDWQAAQGLGLSPSRHCYSLCAGRKLAKAAAETVGFLSWRHWRCGTGDHRSCLAGRFGRSFARSCRCCAHRREPCSH